MFGIKTRLAAAVGHAVPRVAQFIGADGKVWVGGAIDRGASIAEFFVGGGTKSAGKGRALRSRILAQATARAAQGTVSILFSGADNPCFPDPDGRAIVAPLRIALRKSLPDTSEALLAGIKTSTAQEDLRRIRKAGFTFRVTKNPDDIRQFHARHYAPLVADRFPDDGWVMSAQDLIADLSRGGELVCADLDGEWVAGLYNWARADAYSMGPLGIRGAYETVRNKRVVSALLVASMERAVKLGLPTATLGYSLPFLGKGPIWFKAKWGCTLDVHGSSPKMQIFLDLRHDHLRKALALSPILHRDGADLAASTWLMPGEEHLGTLMCEASRFSGITRWYVLADPETMDSAESTLAALLHKLAEVRGFPLPRADSSHGFGNGDAERGEAVQDGHTDLELGNLTVEVAGSQTLAQQLYTMHLCFDAASAVIAAPSSPDRPTEAF